MNVAIVTVGDELLAGETENSNATWLARRLSERGCSVERILTVPDDRDVIARYVRDWSEDFDAVVVTGGLGGTPDDVTIDAVADALDRDLAVDEAVRTQLEANSEQFATENPELVEAYDFDVDLDAAAALPEGGRAVFNEVGWGPGCVVENVYCLPGIPEEMKATFELIADEFGGETASTTLYTPAPEGALVDLLETVRGQFDVRVGSYPSDLDEPARVKITGDDTDAVAAAADWIRDRITVVDGPDETDP
ncbi:MAG: molybdenum cofactor synthesis domain-containing protein [Halobacteriales archaeon]|jgi:molybdenum cofactor synthesis domain-containing protein